MRSVFVRRMRAMPVSCAGLGFGLGFGFGSGGRRGSGRRRSATGTIGDSKRAIIGTSGPVALAGDSTVWIDASDRA
jgi:hypothetical protein